MAPFFTFISVRFDAGQIKSFEDFRMAEITASLVKELRERTGAGMMDCKKALTEANGDIELAIEINKRALRCPVHGGVLPPRQCVRT